MELKAKTMFDLELNETLEAPMQWGVRTNITRVVGGWIYQPINRPFEKHDTYLTPVFVPSNRCEDTGHNMQQVYSITKEYDHCKISLGLNKCSRCGHEENWQYDH